MSEKEFLENKIRRINNLIEQFKDKDEIPMITGKPQDIPHTIKWVSIEEAKNYIKELEEEIKKIG